MEEKKILSTHSLMLENRQNGRITGVKDIKSFDEKEILLFTQAGKLVIKGEQLQVKQLDLEKGEVDLEGKVDSLTYLSKNTDNRDESLFRRMFR
ncbi:sporulation protein YabP [Blautia obeum]|uniref:Sporulation protein YabP n=1 Tax=Blautia obeum TaxID=40520 RepID=A0A174EXL2_9FIRM|nr:sporulation protein YabP [Blautia obeum]CUO42047.1 sporulation protein YabP [Blautia obeum]